MVVGLVLINFRGSAHCASRRPSSRASSGKLVLSALGFRTHRFSARVARRGRSLERSKVRVLLVNSLVRAISRAVAPRAPSFCDASFVPSSRTTTERRPTVGASREAWWRLKDGLRRRAARRVWLREEAVGGKPRREARPLPGRRRQGGRGGVPHAHACSPALLKLVLSHLAAATGLAGANIRERTLRLLLACSSSNLTAASCATRSERSSSSARWGVFAGVGVGASNCWGSKGARQLVRSFFATIHHLISLA